MKKSTLFFCLAFGLSCLRTEGQETITQYLSGTDKDHTVAWDFFCTTGRKSGKWDKIAVPSNWELQGFGTYNYYTDKENPDEQGLYRHMFTMAPGWMGKRIFIVFEGSMTDTEVKINGRSRKIRRSCPPGRLLPVQIRYYLPG